MRFDPLKDMKLRQERGIAFETIIAAIAEGKVLSDMPHPTRENQRVMLVEVGSEVYFVPYVVDEDGEIFLKTAFINRKYRRKKEGRRSNETDGGSDG